MTPKKNDKPVRSNFLRRRRVSQAAADLERGLQDTDRRGTPNDIPTPAVRPPRRRV